MKNQSYFTNIQRQRHYNSSSKLNIRVFMYIQYEEIRKGKETRIIKKPEKPQRQKEWGLEKQSIEEETDKTGGEYGGET